MHAVSYSVLLGLVEQLYSLNKKNLIYDHLYHALNTTLDVCILNTYFIEKKGEQLKPCGKLETECTIQQNFGFEPYLTILEKIKKRRSFTKF